MPYIENSRRVARVDYDFAVDGGAAGAIALRGPVLPGGVIVTDALLQVTQALAGGTVTDTVSIGVEGAADLQAATARNAAPWSSTGGKRVSGGAQSTAPVITTVTRTVTLNVSTSALTAGRFRLYVYYLDPTA